MGRIRTSERSNSIDRSADRLNRVDALARAMLRA
jgi:hypothetical protein